MQINSISTLRENCIHICTEYMDGGSLDQYGAIPEVVLRPVAVSMIQGRLVVGLAVIDIDLRS